MINRKYNLKPDPPDERDYLYKAPRLALATLPESMDLRPLMSPIVDQAWLGSCTPSAIGKGLREYLQIKDGKPLTRLSCLFLYWKIREAMGTINEDSGATIRDGMKAIHQIGCAPEEYQPYLPSKFKEAPTAQANANAAAYKLREYHRILSFSDLQHALAEGLPVVLGANLFESFYEIGPDGIFPMPNFLSEPMIGRHAMLACGYKRINGALYILVRNSYGVAWGDKGYGYMPEAYVKSLHVSDMWTGTASVRYEDITFAEAIQHFVGEGTFDGPEFWANFEARYHAGQLTNADFEYVFLGFRKLAARDKNR